MKSKTKNKIGLFVYFIAVILIVAGFLLPPQGQIDPSVLIASGILIGGFQLLFGHSIKFIDINGSGIHIETHDAEKN